MSLSFQIIDVLTRYEVRGDRLRTLIRFFGRTEDGRSVCVDVANAAFYVYASRWDYQWQGRVNYTFRSRLEKDGQCRCPKCCFDKDKVRNEPCREDQQKCIHEVVTGIRSETGHSFVGYNRDPQRFWKVMLTHPFFGRPMTWMIDGWNRRDEMPVVEWFETDIEPVDRFMIDNGLVGCGWCTVHGDKLDNPRIRTNEVWYIDLNKASHRVVPLQRDTNAPLRTLALDAEMMALQRGAFPTSDKDPIIQLATVLSVYGSDQPHDVRTFMIGSCTPIEGVTIHSFEGDDAEHKLLLAFRNYLVDSDVDIISGYNSNL